MKAYKTADNRVMVYHPQNGYWITSATPTEPTRYSCWSTSTIEREFKIGALQEVVLEEQKWVHPHLLKSIREQMLKQS